MTRDAIEIGIVVVMFAAWVTVHVTIVAGLFARRPRWRGGAALLLPVLAPYWAARAGMALRTSLWCGFAAAYAMTILGAR